MNPIFAQVTQELSFQSIGIAVCMLLLFLVVAVLILQLVDRNKKQSRVVSFEGTPVDRKDFEAHIAANKEEHENIFHKMGGIERGVEARLREEIRRTEADAKESRKNLHNELTTVREDVAALKANAESTDQRTERIERKLDEFIQRAR